MGEGEEEEQLWVGPRHSSVRGVCAECMHLLQLRHLEEEEEVVVMWRYKTWVEVQMPNPTEAQTDLLGISVPTPIARE